MHYFGTLGITCKHNLTSQGTDPDIWKGVQKMQRQGETCIPDFCELLHFHVLLNLFKHQL